MYREDCGISLVSRKKFLKLKNLFPTLKLVPYNTFAVFRYSLKKDIKFGGNLIIRLMTVRLKIFTNPLNSKEF